VPDRLQARHLQRAAGAGPGRRRAFAFALDWALSSGADRDAQLAKVSRSLCMLSNTTAIATAWQRLDAKVRARGRA